MITNDIDPILVTGASGFIGRRLAARLKSEGYSVIDVGGEPGSFTTDHCDLRDREAVHRLIARHSPQTVIHLAAMSSVGFAENESLLTWDVNLGGTANLALACLELHRKVRFVFTSSAEVYGAAFLDGPCSEETPVRPQSVYACTKAAAEWLLKGLASYQFQVAIARPFNHTGGGQDTRFVVPSLAMQIAAAEHGGESGGTIEVGNLDAVRDFSHVDDLVDALTTLAACPLASSCNIFNIGSGEPLRIRTVLDRLIALSSAEIAVKLDPARLRLSDIPVACGKFAAFDKMFGARVRRPFEQALRESLDEARAKVR